MMIQTERLHISIDYPLEELAALKDLLIFDIETTGFSANRGMIYLIGALSYNEGFWDMTWWFADAPGTEPEVLSGFLDFAKNYKHLLHFNGDSFDLPFIAKRCSLLGIPEVKNLPQSMDLYKKVRPLKKLLKLPATNLKTLEQFLGYHRKDPFTGGDLIPLYKEYVIKPDERLKKVILLHSKEDLIGTAKTVSLLAYLDFFNGDFRITEILTEENSSDQFDLIFHLSLTHTLPKQISLKVDCGYMTAHGSSARILINGFQGVLKYFFPEYKNYYYLPAEDTAIHKSVASYVDKDYRKPAKAATCYSKKTGMFLPCLWKTDLPVFFTDYGVKPAYIEYNPTAKDIHATLIAYLTEFLKSAL